MSDKIKQVIVFTSIVLLTGYLTMIFIIRGKQVMVPEIKGLMLENAKQTCSANGLYLEEKGRIYDENLPEGSVTAQEPLPGEYVKKGRRIFVTVSSGLKMISVPDLKDQNLRQAGILLSQSGLKMGSLQAQVNSKDSPKGCVLAQNPPPNLDVKRNTAVEVLVSLGERDRIFVMPNLIGCQISAVRKALYAAKLLTARITYEEDAVSKKDCVTSQSPLPGAEVKSGALVSLTVNGKAGVNRYRQATLKFKVPRGGLIEKRIRIDVMDNDGLRDIFNEILRSGSVLEKPIKLNGAALVHIYVNNELNWVEKYD